MLAHKKIIFFVSEDWFFCTHFLERAKAASNEGHDVVILTQISQHAITIENAGLRFINLKFDRGSINPFVEICTVIRILIIYIKEKPQLVHHVALKPILLGSLAARVARVPYVVNALVGGGYAFISTKLAIRMLRQLLLFLLRILLNPPHSKVVFENSDDLDSYVLSGLVKKNDAILIRGAGVIPEDFQYDAIKSNPPLVVLVARLLWDKGIGEYVEAARLLLQRSLNVRFVIVGEPDPKNRACIDQATLEAWKSEGVVELWGFCSNIPHIYSEATIACLPSYREGLPKSLLEAMAAGLPCVTTDVPGCREAVRDGDNGLLVPAKNVSALAEALDSLIRNPLLASKMGKRGRQRVLDEFSVKHVNESTLILYREIFAK